MSLEEARTKFLDVYNKALEKIGDEVRKWNKVYQFEVEGLPEFYIEFKEGEVNFVEGRHENPLATLRMSQDVLMKILNLEMDPMRAFMMGKLKITGNVIETTHLRKIFDVVRKG